MLIFRCESNQFYTFNDKLYAPFNFMYENYESWSKYHLIPVFNTNNKNSEAAWQSFFYIDGRLSNQSVSTLKPFFIDLFEKEPEWTKSES